MKTLIFALALCMPLGYSMSSRSVEEQNLVYICTGPKAKVYHKTKNCKGLSTCSGSIKEISLESAKSMKRRAGRICY